MEAKPLLLVDIDGVISLWGWPPDSSRPLGRFHAIDGIPHFLSATAGEHLLALARRFEPVWCSGWEDKASEHLPHLLGLERAYPHLSFERNPGRGNAHWKLSAIDAYAGPMRPVAWVDDAHDERCEAWALERPGPTLLVGTNPQTGLTYEAVAQLEGWADGLAAGPAA